MTALTNPIYIDSATGSDTAASGSGPGTAVSGTGASTTASSATVDLSTDSPDLSGISSGDLFWIDSTSGQSFSVIASVDNGAKTVTCDDTFANTESSRNWGIGGKRASLLSASTSKLIDNGGAAGDAIGGWIIELVSGHSEDTSTTRFVRCSGDLTNGPVIIRGASGAATVPELGNTGSNIAILSSSGSSYVHFYDFNFVFRAGATQGYLLRAENITACVMDGVSAKSLITGTAGITGFTIGPESIVRNMHIDGNSKLTNGISVSGSYTFLENVYIRECTTGLTLPVDASGYLVYRSVFTANTTGVSAGRGLGWDKKLIGCVFDNNSGDGVIVGGTGGSRFGASGIQNCVFTRNGGYGVNISDTTLGSDSAIAASGMFFDYNAFGTGTGWANTSGRYSSAYSGGANDVDFPSATDPYTDSSNGDYTLDTTNGANAIAAGFPQGFPTAA